MRYKKQILEDGTINIYDADIIEYGYNTNGVTENWHLVFTGTKQKDLLEMANEEQITLQQQEKLANRRLMSALIQQ
jgi:hypothetical protein